MIIIDDVRNPLQYATLFQRTLAGADPGFAFGVAKDYTAGSFRVVHALSCYLDLIFKHFDTK